MKSILWICLFLTIICFQLSYINADKTTTVSSRGRDDDETTTENSSGGRGNKRKKDKKRKRKSRKIFLPTGPDPDENTHGGLAAQESSGGYYGPEMDGTNANQQQTMPEGPTPHIMYGPEGVGIVGDSADTSTLMAHMADSMGLPEGFMVVPDESPERKVVMVPEDKDGKRTFKRRIAIPTTDEIEPGNYYSYPQQQQQQQPQHNPGNFIPQNAQQTFNSQTPVQLTNNGGISNRYPTFVRQAPLTNSMYGPQHPLHLYRMANNGLQRTMPINPQNGNRNSAYRILGNNPPQYNYLRGAPNNIGLQFRPVPQGYPMARLPLGVYYPAPAFVPLMNRNGSHNQHIAHQIRQQRLMTNMQPNLRGPNAFHPLGHVHPYFNRRTPYYPSYLPPAVYLTGVPNSANGSLVRANVQNNNNFVNSMNPVGTYRFQPSYPIRLVPTANYNVPQQSNYIQQSFNQQLSGMGNPSFQQQSQPQQRQLSQPQFKFTKPMYLSPDEVIGPESLNQIISQGETGSNTVSAGVQTLPNAQISGSDVSENMGDPDDEETEDMGAEMTTEASKKKRKKDKKRRKGRKKKQKVRYIDAETGKPIEGYGNMEKLVNHDGTQTLALNQAGLVTNTQNKKVKQSANKEQDVNEQLLNQILNEALKAQNAATDLTKLTDSKADQKMDVRRKIKIFRRPKLNLFGKKHSGNESTKKNDGQDTSMNLETSLTSGLKLKHYTYAPKTKDLHANPAKTTVVTPSKTLTQSGDTTPRLSAKETKPQNIMVSSKDKGELGTLLKGKKMGDTISYNGEEYEIVRQIVNNNEGSSPTESKVPEDDSMSYISGGSGDDGYVTEQLSEQEYKRYINQYSGSKKSGKAQPKIVFGGDLTPEEQEALRSHFRKRRSVPVNAAQTEDEGQEGEADIPETSEEAESETSPEETSESESADSIGGESGESDTKPEKLDESHDHHHDSESEESANDAASEEEREHLEHDSEEGPSDTQDLEDSSGISRPAYRGFMGPRGSNSRPDGPSNRVEGEASELDDSERYRQGYGRETVGSATRVDAPSFPPQTVYYGPPPREEIRPQPGSVRIGSGSLLPSMYTSQRAPGFESGPPPSAPSPYASPYPSAGPTEQSGPYGGYDTSGSETGSEGAFPYPSSGPEGYETSGSPYSSSPSGEEYSDVSAVDDISGLYPSSLRFGREVVPTDILMSPVFTDPVDSASPPREERTEEFLDVGSRPLSGFGSSAMPGISSIPEGIAGPEQAAASSIITSFQYNAPEQPIWYNHPYHAPQNMQSSVPLTGGGNYVSGTVYPYPNPTTYGVNNNRNTQNTFSQHQQTPHYQSNIPSGYYFTNGRPPYSLGSGAQGGAIAPQSAIDDSSYGSDMDEGSVAHNDDHDTHDGPGHHYHSAEPTYGSFGPDSVDQGFDEADGSQSNNYVQQSPSQRVYKTPDSEYKVKLGPDGNIQGYTFSKKDSDPSDGKTSHHYYEQKKFGNSDESPYTSSSDHNHDSGSDTDFDISAFGGQNYVVPVHTQIAYDQSVMPQTIELAGTVTGGFNGYGYSGDGYEQNPKLIIRSRVKNNDEWVKVPLRKNVKGNKMRRVPTTTNEKNDDIIQSNSIENSNHNVVNTESYMDSLTNKEHERAEKIRSHSKGQTDGKHIKNLVNPTEKLTPPWYFYNSDVYQKIPNVRQLLTPALMRNRMHQNKLMEIYRKQWNPYYGVHANIYNLPQTKR